MLHYWAIFLSMFDFKWWHFIIRAPDLFCFALWQHIQDQLRCRLRKSIDIHDNKHNAHRLWIINYILLSPHTHGFWVMVNVRLPYKFPLGTNNIQFYHVIKLTISFDKYNEDITFSSQKTTIKETHIKINWSCLSNWTMKILILINNINIACNISVIQMDSYDDPVKLHVKLP